MIGIDTNVLVRYLAQDDAAQSPAATRIVEGLTPERPGFVSLVAVVETVWVLTRAYGMRREDIADVLEGLFRAREIVRGARRGRIPGARHLQGLESRFRRRPDRPQRAAGRVQRDLDLRSGRGSPCRHAPSALARRRPELKAPGRGESGAAASRAPTAAPIRASTQRRGGLMASDHLAVRTVKRNAGRSAAAAAGKGNVGLLAHEAPPPVRLQGEGTVG